MEGNKMLGEIITEQETWVARFMGVASMVATWSKDPNNQVGALATVDKGRSMSPGFNGFPRGVSDLKQRLKGEEKNLLTVHAEVNALNNADFDLRGCDLYVTRFPCLACALQIISRGVANLYAPPPEQASRWFKTQQDALGIMQEAGVGISFVEASDANQRPQTDESGLGGR